MPPPSRPRNPSNGAGKRGNDRNRWNHGQGKSKKDEPCRLFAQGRCNYGEKCRFSHNSLSTPTATKPKPTPTLEETWAREEYREWRRCLKRLPNSRSRLQMRAIMDDALKILSYEDRSLQQDIPKDLVDQDDTNGLQWIREIMNMRISPLSLVDDFLPIVRSFLRLITHPAFLDCLSVDTYVGDLYVFICGSSGARAIPFFQQVCEGLKRQSAAQEGETDTTDETLRCLVRAVREVLIRNQKALYHEGLPTLIETIAKLCDVCDTTTKPEMITTRIQVDELQRLRQRANVMLGDDHAETRIDVTAALQKIVRPIYPVLEIPGSRHDNDKTDITQIKIIPTEDEIRCKKGDFLPSSNFDSPYFLQGAERLIDVHFRLLRHDIFDEVKKTLAELLYVHDNKLDIGQWFKTAEANKTIHTYNCASVDHLQFTKQRGLEIEVSFLEPYRLSKKTKAEKQKWWSDTRRLDEGCLLCLVWFHDGVSSVIFLTVSQKIIIGKDYVSLVPDKGRRAGIRTSLVAGQTSHDLEALVRHHQEGNEGKNILIEFPKILLATFVPILENLQRMYGESRLPFSNWIVPNPQKDIEIVSGSSPDIPAPVYARKPGFSFNLNSILSDKSATLSLTPTDVVPGLHDKLKDLTSLDEGQCDALVSALSQEFCLIQGPPGTGKSYLGVQLMRVLVSNKVRASLGPIVVVCYTNHALDQFLEHLIDEGIDNVIRIGSKSSSEAMEARNLKAIARNTNKMPGENYTLRKSHSKREEMEIRLQQKFGTLQTLIGRVWRGFDYHLRRVYPEIHRQFSGTDADGFTTQAKNKDLFKHWTKGLRNEHLKQTGKQNIPVVDLESIINKAKVNIWSLLLKERQTLLHHLVQEIRERTIDGILDELREDDGLAKRIRDVYDEVDRRALETADVIGVTTSGLARRISVLQHIKSRVVICEEAGEVLEAHMLSALIPSVQHLIQIGDHQQLRPQIVNHELSMESRNGNVYQLDRSQFERMALGEYGLPAFPTSQLNVQRRMRPDVSMLIRNTLYEKLTDHDSVKKLPDVMGIRTNVFWFDHEYHEDAADQEIRGRSKSNAWEVSMAHSLVRHVVRQGVYGSQDIAVLTPYVGQLQKLRAALRKDFEIVLSDRDEEKLIQEGHENDISDKSGHTHLEKKSMNELLRIATVDNFQGEEAKVIIISLVRSNKENKVGFLKTSNRINVLLSRAKHGMYLIGNSQTYSNVPMWSNVIGMLRMSGSIGPSFSLRCDRHRETDISVSTPEDFEVLSPQGGCREQCDKRLPRCGHQCRSKCHSDTLHKAFKCPLPCERLFHPCNHECHNLCGDPCGLCQTIVKSIKLPCGHIKDSLLCHQAQDLESLKCHVQVKRTVPGCGHIASVLCFEDVSSKDFVCREPCPKILTCGHKCPGTCHSCAPPLESEGPATVVHQKCQTICGRKSGTCYHNCSRVCHSGEECGLCEAGCEVQCPHSRCSKKCHEACSPCVERCTWACEHRGRCSLPCAAPCDRLPCSKRCTKTLRCGHQCPGLCGERCPEAYCQVCSDKGDARVDMLEFKSYSEIDTDENPIVVLSCGHFFTAETLDGHVGMNDVYQMDYTGEYVSLNRPAALSQFVPRCPDCQRPIQQYATQRYNRVINQAVLDEISRRFIVSGNAGLATFDLDIQALEEKYQKVKERTSIAPGPHIQRAFKDIMRQSAALADKIRFFVAEVSDKEQPVRKLYDATVKAMRERPLDDQIAALSIDNHVPNLSPDQRIVTGSQVKLLKLQYTDITNLLELSKLPHSNLGSDMTLTRIRRFLKSSEEFIDNPVSESFPRMTIEVELYYAKIAFLHRSYRQTVQPGEPDTTNYITKAKEYLEKAEQLCAKGFQGADSLLKAIQESIKLLGKEWYEKVTTEELEAIKLAMVSGRGGIGTHSGHWYNCENGHPFAIGECGMPMELARCPECGAQVGGRDHQAADGVTRATQMEH